MKRVAMQTTLLVTQALHILAGVFWAGSTFALARSRAASADELFRPQMGAAAMATMTGGILWYLLQTPGFGTQGFGTREKVLALGALAAVLAAGVQGALCGSALRQLATAGGPDARSQAQVTLGHRIAAALLALTVICMATARYA
jgi:hypothetical protein